MNNPSPLLRSKLFWVGVLYFAQGFPFGVFYDLLPVHFRTQGIDLREIGLLSLLGLAWTVKFLWAPAVDYYRHHRRWMLAVDLAMGACLVWLAAQSGFGPPVWIAIALFTLASATNDIAIDGYTIELLDQHELGLANGVRIGLARAGILAAGFLLIASDYIGWSGVYLLAAAIIVAMGIACQFAPRERPGTVTVQSLFLLRLLGAALLLVGVGYGLQAGFRAALDTVSDIKPAVANGLSIVFTVLALAAAASAWLKRTPARADGTALTTAPLFGALAEMLRRPNFLAVVLFVLTFKLGDAAMGFIVKPYWIDSGFTATQIGLVSVNLGLVLSIAGGLAGGWYTDRVGIFKALWVLGLAQAVSNLGYVWAASVIPVVSAGTAVSPDHQVLLYAASALESFTGGLGTAAFLAFLMSIVNPKHSAAEYALLSSLFALTRHLAGFASGYGAHYLGYAPYFLLTFFLSFPAYLLLPWIRQSLQSAAVSKN